MGSGRERQIQLRTMAGKSQGNCGAVTKPPEASVSGTSAQGTYRAPTRTQGGQAIAEKSGKLWEIAKLRKTAKIPDLTPCSEAILRKRPRDSTPVSDLRVPQTPGPHARPLRNSQTPQRPADGHDQSAASRAVGKTVRSGYCRLYMPLGWAVGDRAEGSQLQPMKGGGGRRLLMGSACFQLRGGGVLI